MQRKTRFGSVGCLFDRYECVQKNVKVAADLKSRTLAVRVHQDQVCQGKEMSHRDGEWWHERVSLDNYDEDKRNVIMKCIDGHYVGQVLDDAKAKADAAHQLPQEEQKGAERRLFGR